MGKLRPIGGEGSMNWENILFLLVTILQPCSSNVTLYLRIVTVGSTLLCEKQLNPGSRPWTDRGNYPGAPCLLDPSIPWTRLPGPQTKSPAAVFKVGDVCEHRSSAWKRLDHLAASHHTWSLLQKVQRLVPKTRTALSSRDASWLGLHLGQCSKNTFVQN